MKRTILTLIVAVIAFVLGMLFGTPKVHTFNSSAAIAAPAPAPAAVPVPPHCPKVHQAIQNLGEAHAELNEPRHDFCGHKNDAMLAIDAAIKQLKLAEGCAKCTD